MALDYFQEEAGYSEDSSTNSNIGSLQVKYRVNSFDLVSISICRSMDNDGSLDGDFTPAQMFIGFNSLESDSISLNVNSVFCQPPHSL